MPKLTLAQRLKIPTPAILKIIELGAQIPLKLIMPVAETYSLSKIATQYYIPSMLLTAASRKICSLTSNQLGFTYPIIVIHKNLIENKWQDYESTPTDYNTYIGPLVHCEQKQLDDAWEQSPSLPGIEAYCRRATQIKLKYLNECEEWVTCEKSGFESRVIQHACDHLDGKMIINLKNSLGRLQSTVPHLKERIQKITTEMDSRMQKLGLLYKEQASFKDEVDQSGYNKDLAYRWLACTSHFDGMLVEILSGATIPDELISKFSEDREFEELFTQYDPEYIEKLFKEDYIEKNK